MTSLQNSHDLAPNFAGSLYGIINFVGTTSGFIAPLLVAHYTGENVRKLISIAMKPNLNFSNFSKATFEEWRNVFLLGASAYIVTAIVFILFGSGEVQSWNERPKCTPEASLETSDQRKPHFIYAK